jgi:hypothetical protein
MAGSRIQKPSKTSSTNSLGQQNNPSGSQTGKVRSAKVLSGAPHIAKHAPGKLNHNPSVNMHSVQVDTNGPKASKNPRKATY